MHLSISQPLRLIIVVLMAGVLAITGQSAPAMAASDNGLTVLEGETVQGMVTVTGTAAHPTFRKWQVDLLLYGNPEAPVFLALGTEQQPERDALAQFDSRAFPNGDHQIRLRVVHSNLNYDEYLIPITFANGLDGSAFSSPDVESVTPSSVETAPETIERTQPEAPALVTPGNGLRLDATTVTGEIVLSGVADHPTFRKWQLDLLINGDPEQTRFVAVGDHPQIQPGELATLATQIFPDGTHQLRLRVVDSNLNYDEYLTPVTFDNGNPAALAPTLADNSTDNSVQADGSLAMVPFDLSQAPADGVRRIEVDLSDQILTAWQGDAIVLQTLVSTGRSATPTVLGRYNVNRKVPVQRMIGPGYNLPNVTSVMYFFRGYAIHGAYWHDNFGQVMSHGCVNMRLDEAEALFDWAPMGIEVYVHE